MKTLLVILLAWNQLAFADGGIVGNGGEPKAMEFLQIAKDVCAWASTSQAKSYPEILKCSGIIKNMQASLNGPGKAKLRFTDEKLMDKGVSKVAIYNLKEGSITVNRNLWSRSSKTEKYILIAIELAGLAQVKKRYEFGSVASENYKAIYTAKYLSCSVNRTDWYTGKTTNLVPATKVEIDSFDKSFEGFDGEYRVELLVSVPIHKRDRMAIHWIIRPPDGMGSLLENVTTIMDFVPHTEIITTAHFKGAIYTGSCVALGK